jgi:hypothetical protein
MAENSSITLKRQYVELDEESELELDEALSDGHSQIDVYDHMLDIEQGQSISTTTTQESQRNLFMPFKKPKIHYPWKPDFFTSFLWLRYDTKSSEAKCGFIGCKMYLPHYYLY